MQICHNHSIHVVVVQIETPTVSGVYQCTAKLQFEPLYKMAGQCLVYSESKIWTVVCGHPMLYWQSTSDFLQCEVLAQTHFKH